MEEGRVVAGKLARVADPPIHTAQGEPVAGVGNDVSRVACASSSSRPRPVARDRPYTSRSSMVEIRSPAVHAHATFQWVVLLGLSGVAVPCSV